MVYLSNHPLDFFTTGDQWSYFDTEDHWLAAWNEWTAKLNNLGVTIVVAAGNKGIQMAGNAPEQFLSETYPHKWITKNSPFILVGGVYADGSLWVPTTPDSPQAGVISTVYAQAADIPTCGMNGQVTTGNAGTSYAAPAVVSRGPETLSNLLNRCADFSCLPRLAS